MLRKEVKKGSPTTVRTTDPTEIPASMRWPKRIQSASLTTGMHCRRTVPIRRAHSTWSCLLTWWAVASLPKFLEALARFAPIMPIGTLNRPLRSYVAMRRIVSTDLSTNYLPLHRTPG